MGEEWNFWKFLGSQESWISLSLLVVFSVWLILAMLYMIAYAFQLEQWKRRLKFELYHVLISSLLIILSTVLLSNAVTIAHILFAGSVKCGGKTFVFDPSNISLEKNSMLEFVICRFQQIAYKTSNFYERAYEIVETTEPLITRRASILGGVYPINIDVTALMQLYSAVGSALQTVARILGFSTPQQGYMPNVSGTQVIAEPTLSRTGKYQLMVVSLLYNIREKATDLLLGISTIIAGLVVIRDSLMYVLFPIGLLLRLIPFTRGVGNLFIATSLGFYIVYPFILFVTDATFTPITVELSPTYIPPPIEKESVEEFCMKRAPTYFDYHPPEKGKVPPWGRLPGIGEAKELRDLSSIFPRRFFTEEEARDFIDDWVEWSTAVNTYVFLSQLAALSLTLGFISFLTHLLSGEATFLMRGILRLI